MNTESIATALVSAALVMLTARGARAQACAPVQPQGVVVSEGRGGSVHDLALSSRGLAIAWNETANAGYVRAIDPETLRGLGRAQRINGEVRAGTAPLPLLATLGDGSLVAGSCQCSNAAMRCAARTIVGDAAIGPITTSAQSPSQCNTALFSFDASATDLLFVTGYGSDSMFRFAGTSVTAQPESTRVITERAELVWMGGDRFALLRHEYRTPLTATVIDAHGAAVGGPMTLSGTPHYDPTASTIRLGDRMITVTREGDTTTPSTQIYAVTWSPDAAPVRTPLQFPAGTVIEAIAPAATTPCFLAAWMRGSNTELFVGRVCNGALDASTVGSIRRTNGFGSVRLVSDGGRTFVAWTDDTRDAPARSTVRIARVGCQ